jgi:hypothetical protein
MNFTSFSIDTVATMDGGYAIIYPDYTPSSTINPFASYMTIRGFFLQDGNPNMQRPFILYQTPNPVSNITLLDCEFTKVRYGQTCIVVLNTVLATNQNTVVKIHFASFGLVYNITVFQIPADFTYSFKLLDYEGYFLYSTAPNPNDVTTLYLYGYILDDYGNLHNWDMSYPTITNVGGDVLVLSNNTLVIPQPESGQTWSLNTTDLYRVEHGRGKVIQYMSYNFFFFFLLYKLLKCY